MQAIGDELHKFLFEGLPVRGMLVRLGPSWRELLQRRALKGAYAAPVRELLGEMTAAAALMHAGIKFDGALILQIFGDGPVKLAVAEVRSDLQFRATATVVGEVGPDARLAAMLNVQGQGRCAITLDPQDREGAQPYQGVVGLNGDAGEPLQALAEVLEHYMLQSEQLDTRLMLAANDQCAAGLLIQRLPVEGEGNLEREQREDQIGINEAFNRVAHLSATLTREELLTLDADALLRRLYWEEDLRRFEPLVPRFACTCSRERVRRMLHGLGAPEVESIVAERGDVEIGCEFCGLQYRFDAVDVGELFAAARDQPPGSAALQ
ncbi:MAG: Hsp33 family molecular chaperone HslO [Pseudomonadota bacterium]